MSQDTIDGTTTERVLTIEVASFDEATERGGESLRDALDGEPQPARLVFDSPAEALRLLSQERYRLLRAITEYEPESISELARTVERDKGAVSNDLGLLEEHGLVTLDWHGQEKQPTVTYDRIEIDVDLRFEE